MAVGLSNAAGSGSGVCVRVGGIGVTVGSGSAVCVRVGGIGVSDGSGCGVLVVGVSRSSGAVSHAMRPKVTNDVARTTRMAFFTNFLNTTAHQWQSNRSEIVSLPMTVSDQFLRAVTIASQACL